MPSRARNTFILSLVIVAQLLAAWYWWHSSTQPYAKNTVIEYDFFPQVDLHMFNWHDPLTDRSIVFCAVVLKGKELEPDIVFNSNQFSWEQLLQESNAAIAINGGFFEEDFTPAGLAIDNGVRLNEKSDKDVLSGILSLAENRDIQINEASSNELQHWDAVQAGPFVIDPGGSVGILSDDGRSQRRTAIGMGSEGEVVIIVVDSISLYDLSHFLADQPSLFGVESFERVLNLDGGPSTGLFIKDGPKQALIEPKGPVQNLLVFSIPGEEKGSDPNAMNLSCKSAP